MVSVLLAAYGTVLVAELVGDKTLYTLGALGARFRPAPIMAGAAAAFMLKMLAAVLLGQLIASLPRVVVAAISAATFFIMAISIWRKEPATVPPVQPLPWPHAAAISFAAIFLPEWGDAGQIAAALLTARHGAAFVVWLGAVLAMITKAALAVTLGIGLRVWVPQRVVRAVSVALCVSMGFLSAFQIEL